MQKADADLEPEVQRACKKQQSIAKKAARQGNVLQGSQAAAAEQAQVSMIVACTEKQRAFYGNSTQLRIEVQALHCQCVRREP